MKNDNKEVDFGIIENAGLTELESLSGKVPPAGSDEKKKILEMSRRKYDIRKNDNADYNEDTVSGSEPYRPRKLWKIISSAAACIALVGSIAGGAALLHRNSRIPAADTETITDHDVTTETETASATGESTECHQVFLRKGNRPDSPVVLTGNYIKKAEMQYMVDANGESQYVISVELDEEGTEINKIDKVLLLTNSNVKMPDLHGYSVRDFKAFASLVGIKYKIDGIGYLVSQSIVPGDPIKEDSVLEVKFEARY